MSTEYASEVYGSRTLYGAVVAGAAFLLVASLSSVSPTQVGSAQSYVAKAPSTIETVVVTAGQPS